VDAPEFEAIPKWDEIVPFCSKRLFSVFCIDKGKGERFVDFMVVSFGVHFLLRFSPFYSVLVWESRQSAIFEF
jgi:hypothetical protein